jgi:hypothetical protein
VAAVRQVTFQKNLFQISQSRTHTRNTLAEFNEAVPSARWKAFRFMVALICLR